MAVWIQESMKPALHLRCVAILAIVAFVCASFASGQRQLFHEYGSSDGLSNLNVKCLLEDHIGYIWVGTDNGLFRFDGTRFKGFGHADGLANTEILSLAESPDGVLWIGTNSGVDVLSNEHYQSLPDIDQEPTRYIGFDTIGDVYLSNDTGIIRGERAKNGAYNFRTVVTGTVSGLSVNGGEILFGKDGRLWSLKGDNARSFEKSDGLPDDAWGSITQDSLGDLWIRSRTHLYELPRGQTRFADRSDGIPHAAEAHIYADHHGSIFVSSIYGMIVVAGNHRTLIDVRHGMPADPSGPMLIDREELLWMGTDGAGLVRRLGHGEWLAWKREDGLLRNSVWAVRRDKSGKVWVGSNGGLTILNSSGLVLRSWTNHNGLPGDRVLSLLEAPAGDFYVGTDTAGISHFNSRGNLLHTYRSESGYLADRVSSMATDHKGRLWAVGIGGCFRSRAPLGTAPLSFQPMEIPGIPPRSFFRDVLVDDHGLVWIASSRGLARFDGKAWRVLSVHDGLKSSDLGVVSQAQGAIWVAYRDALGMARLEGASLSPTQITVRNGLSSDQIYAMVSDRKGRLWASTDSGLDVLQNGMWRHYGTEDGLIWNDTDSLALSVDSEDNIWIGTSAGLSKFAQPEFPPQEQPPPIVLTSIIGTSREWQAGDDPDIPYSQRSLSIRYTALSYESASTTRFRYRLAGFDDKWIETSERSVYFAALPPGNYAFEVTAADTSGLWNPSPARFTFSIRSPWWRSWWFLSSSFLVVVPVGSGFVRLRIRVLEKQKRELEQQVADRTAELVSSHHQLEEIAYCDMLTNMPNRRMFVEELRKRMNDGTHFEPFALLLIDLDLFKLINDTFGHDAGDAVLIETASRLKAEGRPLDCVARLGGDEFAILLSATQSVAVIEEICHRLLTSLSTQISYKGLRLQVGCSIGVARFPIDGDSQEGLYKSADMALYQAKQKSRNMFCWYQSQACQSDERTVLAARWNS